MNISVRVTATATVVDLEGTVDIGNSPALRSALFDKVSTTSRLALNMSGVRYIDSSGIATLIQVLRKAQDSQKTFVLFGLGSAVYDLLKLTHVLGIFQIFDSEREALEGNTAP